jgi:hypothetical protein
MKLVGDYVYGSAIVNDKRYAITRNHGELVSIRKLAGERYGWPTLSHNEVLWEAGQPMTEEVLLIVAAEI